MTACMAGLDLLGGLPGASGSESPTVLRHYRDYSITGVSLLRSLKTLDNPPKPLYPRHMLRRTLFALPTLLFFRKKDNDPEPVPEFVYELGQEVEARTYTNRPWERGKIVQRSKRVIEFDHKVSWVGRDPSCWATMVDHTIELSSKELIVTGTSPNHIRPLV